MTDQEADGNIPGTLDVPGIVEIDHVGLAVVDLDAAVRLHTAVLGGRLEHQETNERQGVVEAMIAFDGGTRIQLLEPSPGTPRWVAS